MRQSKSWSGYTQTRICMRDSEASIAMTNPTQLSIVTVVKDDIRGFRRTFESLSCQTIRNFEWVIVDSSELDEVHKLVAESKLGFPVNYINSSPNGIYPAMNLGLRQCVGDWVWYLNAGDILTSPDAITEATGWLKDDIGSVAFAVQHVDAVGRIRAVTTPKLTPRNLHDAEYIVANINHQGFISKKELIIGQDGFDESLKFAGDGKLLDSLVTNFSIELHNDILVSFEIGGASTLHFRALLNEIDSYRPFAGRLLQHRLAKENMILRNRLRRMKIWFLASRIRRAMRKNLTL